MDRDSIIDGLRMTMDLFTFDPSTGEGKDPDDLNDLDRTTYDACKGALEILERLDTDSDTISRQQAIEALYHVDEYNGRSVEAIRKLPPAQPTPDQNGDLWITVPDIDEVTCVYVQENKSKFCRIFYEEQEQPERIIHCKDCEWWTKQECSPQGRCALSGMYPTGGWFCGNARRREVTT